MRRTIWAKTLAFCVVALFLVFSTGFVLADELPDVNEGSKAFNALNEVIIRNSNCSDLVDLYGGAYIEDDVLYVYYREDINIASLELLTNDTLLMGFDIVFIPSEYSYKQLYEMMKYIGMQKEVYSGNESHWTSRIEAMGINQIENCLDCYIDRCDGDELQVIEENLSSYPTNIIFVDDYKVEKQSTLYPGEGINCNGNSISLGFRCKYNGNPGFLTTIHSSSIGATVYKNNNSIGQVTLSVDDGCADFSFVKITNTNYSVSLNPKGISNYSLQNYHYAAPLPSGYSVYFAGRNQYGVVTGNVYYDGYHIYSGDDWLCCTYSCSPGDSGGCVFTKVSTNNIVVAVNDGIVYDINTQMNYSYSTKFESIISDYYSNLVLY